MAPALAATIALIFGCPLLIPYMAWMQKRKAVEQTREDSAASAGGKPAPE